MRENVQDAIRGHDMEGAVRIFLDGVMRKEGFLSVAVDNTSYDKAIIRVVQLFSPFLETLDKTV